VKKCHGIGIGNGHGIRVIALGDRHSCTSVLLEFCGGFKFKPTVSLYHTLRSFVKLCCQEWITLTNAVA